MQIERRSRSGTRFRGAKPIPTERGRAHPQRAARASVCSLCPPLGAETRVFSPLPGKFSAPSAGRLRPTSCSLGRGARVSHAEVALSGGELPAAARSAVVYDSPSPLFPRVAQLAEIWLHMQTLSPNCNLIFCSAGQRDQHLSSRRPRPPPRSHVPNCHRDAACQRDAGVRCSPSPRSHSGNKPIISSCFHDG